MDKTITQNTISYCNCSVKYSSGSVRAKVFLQGLSPCETNKIEQYQAHFIVI